MYRFFISVLLFCLILTGCGGGDGGSDPKTPLLTRSAVLDQEFTLRVGQDALLETEGLTVILRAVPDDYRCPEDAVCGWEGNARVQVELKTASDPGTAVEFNTSTRMGSRETTYAAYSVQMLSVAPNQRSNRTIKADEYTVSLLIKKR